MLHNDHVLFIVLYNRLLQSEGQFVIRLGTGSLTPTCKAIVATKMV